MPLKMPTPGTREPAQISLINDNMLTVDAHDHTTGKGVAASRLRSGLDANRPAASAAGQVYFATDTGMFYVDTGTAWVNFLTSGGASTVTGWTLVDPIVRNSISWGAKPSGSLDTVLTRSAGGVIDFTSAAGATKAWMTFRSNGAAGSGRIGQPVAAGTTNVWLTANADYDGTNWNRDAVASPTVHLSLGSQADTNSDVVWSLLAARSGANPITFLARMRIFTTGSVSFTPDAGLPVVVGATSTVAQTWATSNVPLQIGSSTVIAGSNGAAGTSIAENAYYNSGWKFLYGSNPVSMLSMSSGGMTFYNCTAGAAGAAIPSLTARLQIATNGAATFTSDASIRSITTNNECIIGSGHAIMLADPTNNYYMGWRMSNASPATLMLAYWGGDTNIAFGTDGSLHLVYLYNISGNHLYIRGPNTGLNLYQDQWGSVMFTHMGGGDVGPAADNAYICGQPSIRWSTVYSVNGVSTSDPTMKDDLGLLDPDFALAEVARVPIHRFKWKEQPEPDFSEWDAPDDADDRTRSEHADRRVEAERNWSEHKHVWRYERAGFMADEAANPADPDGEHLLLVGDVHVDPQQTACVALAAIKALLTRVAALEAANAKPA